MCHFHKFFPGDPYPGGTKNVPFGVIANFFGKLFRKKPGGCRRHNPKKPALRGRICAPLYTAAPGRRQSRFPRKMGSFPHSPQNFPQPAASRKGVRAECNLVYIRKSDLFRRVLHIFPHQQFFDPAPVSRKKVLDKRSGNFGRGAGKRAVFPRPPGKFFVFPKKGVDFMNYRRYNV